MSTDHNQALSWLFFISASLIFIGLGLRDPWPADEPRFALIAKEMVATGQWFFPARAQELYPDKPPIFMWSIAVFYWLFGSIKFTFLLPSALSGLLTTYLVYDIGRKLWSVKTGFIAALLLIFSLQFMLQAKTAQIDAMVCAWITLGCYGFLRFMLYDGKWLWCFIAWFFMGIGVITKGVGFLPILMLIPYITWQWFVRKENLTVKVSNKWRWALGPFIMLFAIALWFVPMLWLVDQSHNPFYEVYRDNILFKQTVTRYANSWHHIKPFWYYITSVIPIFWLPLSLALPWLIKPWWKAIKQADGRIILPLGWVILVILFFSISSGKRGVYLLPALPMLALITAPYLSSLIKSKGLNWLIWSLVTLISVLLVVLAIAGIAELNFATKLSQKYNIEPWFFLLSIGALGTLNSVTHYKYQKWQTWPYFIAILWILYSTWGYRLLNEPKTPHNIYQQISQLVDTKAEIALVDFSEQFILFSPYRMTHFGYHTENHRQLVSAWNWQKLQPNRHVLMNYELIDDCYNKEKAIHLGFAHRVGWVLLGNDSRLKQCNKPVELLKAYRYGY
nr:glycosyltransferase family 39 protein [Paraglaciecola sp. L3A3]